MVLVNDLPEKAQFNPLEFLGPSNNAYGKGGGGGAYGRRRRGK